MLTITETIAHLIEQLRQLVLFVPGFSELAQAPYIFRPFVLVSVLGVVGAIVGTVVNLRGAEFNAEAMVHAVFPGIVGGAIYGGIDAIIPAASAVGVIAAIALAWVTHISKRRGSSEAGTAVVLTGFFSLGVIISLHEGDMSGQLESLMFGRLLAVTDTRLVQALVVAVMALAIIAVTWRKQIAYAFDADGARASGLRLGCIDLILNSAVAAVVVSASSAIGTLLVIAYVVVPAAAARLVSSRISTMLLIGIGVGVASGYIGLRVATAPTSRPLSPQATVCAVMILFFLSAAALVSWRHASRKWRHTEREKNLNTHRSNRSPMRPQAQEIS